MTAGLAEDTSNKADLELNIRKTIRVAWATLARHFLRPESRKIMLLWQATSEQGLMVSWGFNQPIKGAQGCIGQLLLLFLLSGLWAISISQKYLCCYRTFQNSDNGHSKQHMDRKDDFMSRQGFGNKLKSLDVCILMRGSRWTLPNGSTEGGWRNRQGLCRPRTTCY